MAELRPHVIDGIEEYDNPLPRWWLYGFYLSIAFAIVYAIMYPSLWFWRGTANWTSASQYTVWDASLPKKDPAAGPPVDLTVLSKDATRVAAGKVTFKTTCAVCHGDNAEGKVGPPLVKHDWRYGSDSMAIMTTIRGGRPAGMPTWSKTMSEDQMQNVAAYVWTLSEGKWTDGHGPTPTGTLNGSPAPSGAPAAAASGAPAASASGAPAAAASGAPAASASGAPAQ